MEGGKARLHEGYREVCMSLYNKFNFKRNFNQCFRKKLNWKGTARVLHFWSSLTFFLSFLCSKNLGSHSRIFYPPVRLATKINRLDMKTTPPVFRSTVINPNVFLLSLELLAWLVQTNCYLAWTSNSPLAFPSRHSGSLENNQDIRQFRCDKYVRENLLGLDLKQSG